LCEAIQNDGKFVCIVDGWNQNGDLERSSIR